METGTFPFLLVCYNEQKGHRGRRLLQNRRGLDDMELQQRKINRIPDYDYGANGAYFITICTQDRKPILSHIVGDGFPVPKTAGKIAEEYIRHIPEKYPTVSVDQYVIMPDHIHMLLRMGNS